MEVKVVDRSSIFYSRVAPMPPSSLLQYFSIEVVKFSDRLAIFLSRLLSISFFSWKESWI